MECLVILILEVHNCVNLRSSFSFCAEYLKICVVKNEISNVVHLIVVGSLEGNRSQMCYYLLLPNILFFVELNRMKKLLTCF